MGRAGNRLPDRDEGRKDRARTDSPRDRAAPPPRTEPTAILVSARRLCRDLLSAYLADSLGTEVLAAADLQSVNPSVLSTAEIAVCCLQNQQVYERFRKALGRTACVAILCGGRESPADGTRTSFVRCADGLSGLTRGLQRALGPTRRDRPEPSRKQRSLTARQLEVVRRVATGWTNARIGQALGLSPRTVEAHRLHAMKRLGVRTTAQLVVEAARLGFIGLGPRAAQRTEP